jgi:hypothetical protein
MALSPEDIRYASDHRARIARRFWLVILVGLLASWKWLLIIFGCFAVGELIKMQRVLTIPAEDNWQSRVIEFCRGWGNAAYCTICAYIPVFVLGSLVKLLRDFTISFFK